MFAHQHYFLSDDIVLRVNTCEELCHVVWRLQQQLLLTRVTVYHTEIASRHSVETVTIIEGEWLHVTSP